MKNQKILITIISTILCVQSNFSQEFTIPNDVKLDSPEDYKKHEADILNCINWLENTPVNQNPEKRTKANAFLMLWATGTPTVTIEMQSFQLDLTKKNSGLLMTFMGGWIKHSIENPNEKNNTLANNIAGINSLIKVYSSNKGDGIKKDKRVEKLVKMNEDELEKWVVEKIE